MWLRLALLPAGIAFGIAVEAAFYNDSLGPALTAADFAVGSLLIVCGATAWNGRPQSRVGALMTAAGLTWFLGNVSEWLLFLHRGPLVHLHLSYPTGRLPTRLSTLAVLVAYAAAVVEPLAESPALTLVLSGLIAVAALRIFLPSSGPARKAGGPALAAAMAFAAVLALAAVNRLAGWDADRAVLWAYDAVIATIAVVLLRDLLRGRWAEAAVTGLVVELGAEEVGTLRAKLARALGDPSLVVGYRLQATGGFVDDAGRPVELPAPDSGRTVTAIDEGGEQVAILVHDEALLADATLVDSVAAAARIAVANARLQAQALARAAELEASRRRIVEAGDEQRRRLERELRVGTRRRLERVAGLLADARRAADSDAEAIAALEADLEEAERELRDFAQGVHPAALAQGGLEPALAVLAERSPVPVQVGGGVGRLSEPIEAALFFVCSESLANVAKHSAASRVSIHSGAEGGRVIVTISDDGIGGADPSRGSGLRGLADRVEALGGRLTVESPPSAGTRVVVELPLGR
jgi:signal transduction histidine kinase